MPRPAPRPSLIWILGLWSLFLVPSCRSSESFRDPPSELVASSAPLDVTLSNELRGLGTKAEIAGSRIRFRVGNLLRGLFDSNDGRSFLTLVDSKIDITRRDLGWRSEYLLVVALQKDGRYYLIQGNGIGASEESPKNAGRSAIEECISSVHIQLTSLLQASSRARSGGR